MDSKYIMTANGELYHWGIKGMKWGIRRYQNPDGSLTAAGQKRYDDQLNKIEAKTKKLREKQAIKQEAEDRKNKLKAAKQALADAKKGKKVDDDPDEDDEAKKKRILDNPNAKEVYENKHLFSNTEIQNLKNRLDNESNIKKLIPEPTDKTKERVNRAKDNISSLTDTAVVIAKGYNMFANVFNAFGDRPISLPKIDTDVTKGNRETRYQDKKRKKENEKEKKG